ncbi:MAG: hypothetical protein F6J97_04675 [Leptolyngbya sp. SIO4C1]|nr:hypothetical protein [Leptolyngbya sp. SIO4C1]
MLKQLFVFCAAAWLIVQIALGFVSAAVAAQPLPMAQTAPDTEAVEPVPETPPVPEERPAPPQTRRNRQQRAYPDPPDAYDYESLRQYDEEIYGEETLLQTLLKQAQS